MPNWCSNIVTFRHENPEMIAKVKLAAENDQLFQTFVPIEKENGDRQDVIDAWGTKWDASECTIDFVENNTIKIYFMTAWGPPDSFYEAMNRVHDFSVDALWNEPGMGLLGSLSDGFIENFPYPTKPEDFEDLPEEFENEFRIESDFYEFQLDDYAESL